VRKGKKRQVRDERILAGRERKKKTQREKCSSTRGRLFGKNILD